MDDSALQNIQSNMDDLESEIVGQVNEKKFDARKEKFQSILGDTKLELSEGTDLVKKGMQVFDQFVHTGLFTFLFTFFVYFFVYIFSNQLFVYLYFVYNCRR